MEYISCNNLCFSYGEEQVLKNVTFCVNKGESIGIIGANGAGKSTLLQILVGLLDGYTGEVQVCGKNVEKKNFTYIRKKTGFVFQDFDAQLFMPTAYEDVCFGPLNNGFSKEEATKKADTVFKMLDIERLKNKYTHKMSGGEKKLVSIATVLVSDPECILFDEPTTGLDPKNRAGIIRLINSLNITKLITTHDLNMALEICTKIMVFKEGQIAAEGTPEKILFDKELMEECDLISL